MDDLTKTQGNAVAGTAPNLDSSGYYLNRHLSLMNFNLRVLEQAFDESYPLLQRFQFLLIFSSNMDEFFEIRMAGLKRQISFSRETIIDGMHPRELLRQLSRVCLETFQRQYRLLNETMLPALAGAGIRFPGRDQWSPAVRDWAAQYFRSHIMPIISPIGLDPAHPFPRLVNKSLNFIASLDGRDAFGRESGLAIVPARCPD